MRSNLPETMNNLTDPVAVRHALYAKFGQAAIKKAAKVYGISAPYLVQMLDGKRTRRADVFTGIATLLNRPVFGFYPANNNDCKQD